MSLRHAILGFLSWRPLTGYDLKKLLADSEFLHWSGNNNQIYTALLQLHRDQWVTVETKQQESLPPRKLYALTDAGRGELRSWVLSPADLPEARSSFLVQLVWADRLETSELDELASGYERAVEMQLLMCREKLRRGGEGPDRTAREKFLWKMAGENRARAWEAELEWVRDLKKGLARLERSRRKQEGP